MKFRKAVIGVRHKGCWGSLCTLKFPNIIMKEKGPINVEKAGSGVKLSACWDVEFQNKEEFGDFLKHLGSYKLIKKIKVIELYDTHALIKTEWTGRESSYALVLKNNCLYTSPVTQKDGYEIYEVVTEEPKKLVKLIETLDGIGEAKLFSVSRLGAGKNKFNLTEKQANAIQVAVSHNFYEWPRKVSLDEVAAMVGMKRRTFQENLRKAESKVIPQLVKNFFTMEASN